MIIERKYEWLGALYDNDALSRKVIDEAFFMAAVPEDEKKELIQWNYYHISRFLNIGCGIPGNTFGYFMDKFEELDKENPYDNGLTFKDFTDIEYETSKKGTAIQMRFVNKGTAENPCYRIVGFASVENRNGK